MTTTFVEPTPLGATATNKWRLEVNRSHTETPDWLLVRGIFDFKDNLDVKTEDTSTFESDEWESSESTTKSWAVDLKCRRQKSPEATEADYDEGQEFLKDNNGEVIEIRYCEMAGDGTKATGMPRKEAYQGKVNVKWSPDGGKHTDKRSVSVTLAGNGKRNEIAHPYPNK